MSIISYFRVVKSELHTGSSVLFPFPEIYLRHYGNEPEVILKNIQKNAENTFAKYSDTDRKLLVTVIKSQNDFLKNESVNKNIEILSDKNTFTVCTGHQLCLFGGPLFFTYKIISTIKLAEEFSNKFPDKKFVPVFWMASEDHDLEEISSFHLFGKKIQWNTEQKGAVGRFNTNGIDEIIKELKVVKGNTPFADEFIAICEKAYAPGNSLAKATRIFVNELFGEYGIVCLDGDDSALKKLFVPVMLKEINECIVSETVNEKNNHLESIGIKPQVNPREINLFYLSANSRKRIIKTKDGNFAEHDGQKKWSNDDLINEISTNPQNFSPNVLMRPLYQQTVLPNAAYIGGPGELAYWMQLPELFEKVKIPFPACYPRKSMIIIDEQQQKKIKKFELSFTDLMETTDELIKKYISEKVVTVSLEAEKQKWEKEFLQLAQKIKKEEPNLETNVFAESKAMQKYLEALEAKLNKAKKHKHEQEINQLKNLKEKLFPGGEMQERVETLIPEFWKWGIGIIRKIYNSTAASDFKIEFLTANE